jgi:hypothetical protein
MVRENCATDAVDMIPEPYVRADAQAAVRFPLLGAREHRAPLPACCYGK